MMIRYVRRLILRFRWRRAARRDLALIRQYRKDHPHD